MEQKIRIPTQYTKSVMHSAISHHPLTDAQPVPKQQSHSHGQILSAYILNMASYGVE